MTFHVNRPQAHDSHEMSRLVFSEQKKIECRRLQILLGALRVNMSTCSQMNLLLPKGVGVLFIALGLNDTSALVGHFVSSPRERKEIEKRVEEMKGRDREVREIGMKVKKQKK